MAEVKVNVGSPFHKKYQESGMTRVLLDVFIYSGTKSTDRGTPKYTMEKEPIGSDDYVIFDLTDLVKDYLQPTLDLPLNSNKDYLKWVELHATIISDKPTANDMTVVTDEETPLTIELSGDDPEFRPLTFTKVTDPSNGTLGPITSNRRIVYTPNDDFVGVDSFTFKANNGVQDSDDATVSIVVRDVISELEYDFNLGGDGTTPATSLENALYNYYYSAVGSTSYGLRFKGSYADTNDDLSFRIGMVGTSVEYTGTPGLTPPDGFYPVFVFAALIGTNYWGGLNFPNGPYTFDDLSSDFQNVLALEYDNLGNPLYGYLLVVRVQGGIIRERYEFKESDVGVFNGEYITFEQFLERLEEDV